MKLSNPLDYLCVLLDIPLAFFLSLHRGGQDYIKTKT